MTQKKEDTKARELVEVVKIETPSFDTPLRVAVDFLSGGNNSIDNQLETINTSAESVCNDLVRVFTGLTKQNYDSKRNALFLKANINFKAKKGVCRNDALKLTGTASTVISTTKRYILADMSIDKDTTYSSIKEFFKVEITQAEKDVKKAFSGLSLNEKIKALELFVAHKKEVAEKLKKENALFEAKKEAQKKKQYTQKEALKIATKNSAVIQAVITKKGKNQKSLGAMAGIIAK